MYEAILIPAAALMVYITAVLVKWAHRSRERVGFSLVLFVLSMMTSMLVSAVVYFTRPDLVSLEIGAGVSFTVMTLGLAAVLYSLITQGGAEKSASAGSRSVTLSFFRSFVILLVLLNEVFMGWSFSLVSGFESAAFLNASSIWTLIDLSVNSYWFTFTMSAEMLLTLFYFRQKLTPEMRVLLFLQALLMLLAPTALTAWGLSSAAVYAGSAVMIILFIYIFDFLYKNRQPSSFSASYIMRLMVLYAFMMAALFYWSGGGSALFFGASLIAEMIVFFDVILRREARQKSSLAWQKRPAWALSLLFILFVAEYFMAGVMDAVYFGTSFLDSFRIVPLSGSAFHIMGAALFDFVISVAAVTGTVWFYTMMGIEMGALVFFQIKKVKQLETKVRLALVIVAYAIYTVIIPYFLFRGSELRYLPFLGWNMGVGTGGAFAPALLVGIGGTYLISGTLSFLFGGRQVCSLFCSAALMYQGTFYDSTKSFNRTSRTARATHRNSLGSVFGVTATLVWTSIFASVLLSYLDSTGVLNLSVFGVDPVVFAYIFYFNFLWYVVFITIPYVGTYGCVTTGICHWGMFNQLIGRLGLFRLKVNDRHACVTCKTKDCVNACPVGLTSLPGAFIEKGEFKNYKCIGVGQCASACPVDNIFFYDARHWFKERISGRKAKGIQNVLLVLPRNGK